MPCCNLMVCYILSVKGFVCASSVSRLDWCRASSWVQDSAFCCFSIQGRCGCSQRQGGHRLMPRHTDTVFHSCIQLHAPCYTNTQPQPSTFLFCPFFLSLFNTAHLSVRHAIPVFPSLSKCLLVHLFPAMPSKKKKRHPLSTLIHIHDHPFSNQPSLSSVSATAYLVLALPFRDLGADDE